MNSAEEIEVVEDVGHKQFEGRIGGTLVGFITYRLVDGTRVLLHTEVLPEAEGKGVGSHLVRGAFELVRGRGEKVRIVCPFISDYLERHPEEGDVVAN
ncbi:MAG TPA: GNAT family N-acetyltransferase [Thermoleophilia bacterium]|nr:GNAT family N-acetyltransferase [Thermoleophilia bacterium]